MKHQTACLLIFSTFFAFIASSVWADTVFLKTGSMVKGNIIELLGETLTIKYGGTDVRKIIMSDIDRVETRLEGGAFIGGELLWWSYGTYLLATDQGVVWIRNGLITKVL